MCRPTWVISVPVCVPVIQKGDSIMATVKYVHTVKPTAAGGVITRATALEQQHFTPFNIKGGSFKMQAT